ncbi:subtilisin-like protease SBT3.18 [Selaginella moellendorffii]|uniref:subtilisin-like protease SBT3.18 n=1 Tax=Selaginella moellendorffii TaxID=88036 RepID=UPI000D1CB17D|nr:subtilisin-like protease SBT3.18 [Selaginella moellendorffii]|eukprot:XP_024543366.1 subtilisin-like protease SBT3.18 [Selaginella moellendorffii]
MVWAKSPVSGEGYVKKEMPSTLHTATGKYRSNKKENKVPGILSARDDDGHGTHTASTLAGRLVQNASVVGRFAQGTAAGGVPGARLAAYKACWGGDDGYCHESDLIAAMDQAVHDGVDVISMSNGGEEYVNDVVALAALSAVKKGVTVVASAGNEGVKGMGNSDPWFITVGASSMDRWGSARLSLGNGMTFTVQGKIVLCMRKRGKDILAQSSEVRDAGGAGMILYEDVKNEQELMDDWHYVPSIHISAKDALAPDITAPGVDILAAWPPNVDLDEGRGRGNFNFQSGTSMSCPHVAAYIGNGLANGTPNDFGSGHINPNAAAHPGLIYDLDYNKIPVKAFGANKILSNLNFPSVGISRFHTKYTVKRTGNPNRF